MDENSCKLDNVHVVMISLYLQPAIATLSPKVGPRSGGTDITLTGRELDAGAAVVVTVGGQR